MRNARCVRLVLVALIATLVFTPVALALRLNDFARAQTAPQADTQGNGASIARAVEYLRGRQQQDGGFAEPGKSSSALLTTWTICGLASTGQDVSTWRKSGSCPLDYLSTRAAKLKKLTELEITCLAVCCAGGNPRSFGSRNLVAEIRANTAADGHIGDLVNEHCWGVIALKAAGEIVPEGARAWLAARQNIDGGFGYGADTGSDPDDTGAALQALIAAGESPQGNTVKRAISYLRFCQAPDAGFSYNTDQSNIASTAWAVQGIVAAGQDPASADWTRSGKTPLDYLAGTQQSDGHFRYMKSSDANPAWMTAEALPAIEKRQYPLGPSAGAEAVKSPTQAGETSPAVIAGTQGTPQAGDGEAGGFPAPSSETGGGEGRGREETGADRNPGDLLSLTAGGARPASRSAGTNELAVFVVFCATYAVLLGLVYVSLSFFYSSKGRS